MATRALINIVERQEGRSFSKQLEPSAIHTQIYKHWDGYPEGLGVTLASYLDDYIIANGLSTGYQGPVANGIGCLAAQLVGLLKDEPGNVYLQPPQEKDYEDYEYYIWVKENEGLMISIFDYDNKCLFVGNSEELENEYKSSFGND